MDVKPGCGADASVTTGGRFGARTPHFLITLPKEKKNEENGNNKQEKWKNRTNTKDNDDTPPTHPSAAPHVTSTLSHLRNSTAVTLCAGDSRSLEPRRRDVTADGCVLAVLWICCQ